MKNLYINKRLLASVMALTLVTTSFTGCGEYENFDYEVTENGTVECNGRIDYYALKRYKIVELTIFDKKEMYVAKEFDCSFHRLSADCYANIFTNQEIYNTKDYIGNASLEIIGNIADYLLYYDMIKTSYSKEDVEDLLAKIKEDRVLKEENTLVKK